MSQLSGGPPISGIARNRGQQTQQTGTTGTLAAPGAVPVPPVSSEANEARQALEAMGFVGKTAKRIGNIVDRHTDQVERENEKIKHQYRAQANFDWNAAMPQFLQDVEDGNIVVPDINPATDEPYTVEQFARDYFNNILSETPPEYAKEYFRGAVPRATAVLIRQQEVVKKRNQEEDIEIAGEGRNPAEIASYLKETYPDLTETQVLDSATKKNFAYAIGNPLADDAQKRFDDSMALLEDNERMQTYAAQQDKRFTAAKIAAQGQFESEKRSRGDRAVALLYNRHEEEERRTGQIIPYSPAIIDAIERGAVDEEDLRQKLDAHKARVKVKNSQIESAASDVVVSTINDAALSKKPLPTESLRKLIESNRETLGEDRVNQLLNFVTNEEERRRKEAEKRIVAKSVATQEQEIQTKTLAAIRKPELTGMGAIGLAERDFDVINPLTGEVVKTINGNTMVQNVRDAEVDRMAAELPVDEFMPAVVNMLASNGGVSSQLKGLMQNGWLATALSTQGNAPDDNPTSPAEMKGFETYLQMRRLSRPIADRHLNADAQEFYDMAWRQLKYTNVGDTGLTGEADEAEKSRSMQGALNNAKRIRNARINDKTGAFSRLGPAARAEAKRFATKDISWWPFYGQSLYGIKNHRDIAEMVLTRAESIMAAEGLSAEDAVKNQYDWVVSRTVIVNGYAIDRLTNEMPKDFPDQLDFITQELETWYMAQRVNNDPDNITYAEAEGIEKGDLVFVPGPQEGSWQLYNAATHRAVDNWRTIGVGVISTPDLITLFRKVTDAKHADSLQEYIDNIKKARHSNQNLGVFVIPFGLK